MLTANKIDEFMRNPELARQYHSAVSSDYELFATEFMGHIVKEVPPFHHEMYQALNQGYKHSAFIVFRGGAKCLHELSPVLKDDYTQVAIKDIAIGDKVKSVQNGFSVTGIVTNKEFVGLKSGYELKLKHGQSLVSSLEHKYLTVS